MSWLGNLVGALTGKGRTVVEPVVPDSQTWLDPFSVKSVGLAAETPRAFDGKALWSSWSTGRAISEGMKSTTWVYACVTRLAEALASLPFAIEVQDQNKWVRSDDASSPLLLLMEAPNEFWSRQELIERMVCHLLLGGNAVVTKTRGVRGIPVELWALSPDAVKPVPSKTNYVAHYLWEFEGEKRVIATSDICHVMFTDPATPLWGLSPMQAAARVVDTEVEAINWNKISLQNRCVTDGVFSFGHELTKSQWEEARRQVREQHMGSPNARMPWVLGSDARYTPMSMSPVEMDFMNSRRFTREEIAATFRVPLPVLGVLDQATYNNIQTAYQMFWNNAVLPLGARILGALNRSISPEFIGKRPQRLTFDLSSVDVLNEISKEKAETASVLHGLGVPFAVLNDRLGLRLPRFPGDSIGYLNGIPVSGEADDFGQPSRLPGNADDEDLEAGKALEALERSCAIVRRLAG